MQQRIILLVISVFFLSFPARADRTAEETSRVFIRPGPDGYVSSWTVLGPFFSGNLSSISLADIRRDGPHSTAVGTVFSDRTWTAYHGAKEGFGFSARPKSAVILYGRIVADGDRSIWASTGSNGPLEMLVNGQSLLKRDLTRKNFPDTDLTRIPLKAGANDFVIVLHNLDQRGLRGSVRLLDDEFLPAKVKIELPEDSTAASDIASQKGSVRLRRKVDLREKTTTVQAFLTFPGGIPEWSSVPPIVDWISDDETVRENRVIDPYEGTAAKIDLGRYRFDASNFPSEVVVSLGNLRFRKHLGMRLTDIKRLIDANANLEGAIQKSPIEKTTYESLSWRIAHLKQLVESGDEDFMYIDKEGRDTVRMTSVLNDGKDPYQGRNNQVQRRGYRSELDGSLQPYVLYVPPGWREDDDRRFGLLVALHGLNSGPMKTMQAVFGVPMVEGETKQLIERYPKPVDTAPMFVLAPYGFGNSGYRAFGEQDVLDAMEQVMRRYRIHPNRVYITGASMGGIGAAALPLHYPEKFAAAAPLCGYHSMFYYRGVLGRVYRPFEQFLLESRSNAYWATNGRYVPMYMVHGLKDSPAQSRILVKNYRKLGYEVTYETPNLGHNVWDLTYKDGRIFGHFQPYKRDAHPRQIAFVTSTLRYSSSRFIRIDAMSDYGKWARVDADWQKDNTVLIRTENASQVTVLNDAMLQTNGELAANIDGARIPLPPESVSWSFTKQSDTWKLTDSDAVRDAKSDTAPPLRKRSGLSGPIEDALYEPLLFVYGTDNPAEKNLAGRLIYNLIDKKSGITVNWPIKADRDVTETDLREKSIVIVGTPKGNSLLGKIGDELPIRVEDNTISVGDQKYTGRAPAAVFIYPNPLNPDRYVTVYTAASLEGLYYIGHLPDALPDYVVFDGPEMTYKNGRIFDSRPILDAGFFDENWKLPGQMSIGQPQ